jgi:hypothetical protein
VPLLRRQYNHEPAPIQHQITTRVHGDALRHLVKFARETTKRLLGFPPTWLIARKVVFLVAGGFLDFRLFVSVAWRESPLLAKFMGSAHA